MTERTSKPHVTITADGAARGNPGPGGWAALLEANGKEKLLHGSGPEHTTNNAMEIQAVAEALETLKRPCQVVLRLDSRYVLDGLQRLLGGAALPQKNRELWARLQAAAQRHDLQFEWVRGHNGDQRNERVDRAATAQASRVFLAQEERRALPDNGPRWTLALCSPTAQRPAEWAVLTPEARLCGSVPVRGGASQPTTVYLALVQALEAASALAGAAEASLVITSNYELIIKQGRGEWQVKNAEQQPLARQVAALRGTFGQTDIQFAPTDQIRELLGQASA